VVKAAKVLAEFILSIGSERLRGHKIKLSDKGRTIVRYFFKTKPLPSWSGWSHNLERWAEYSKLDPVGLGPKTTRKTWESWLVSSYPERFPEIVVSQRAHDFRGREPLPRTDNTSCPRCRRILLT